MEKIKLNNEIIDINALYHFKLNNDEVLIYTKNETKDEEYYECYAAIIKNEVGETPSDEEWKSIRDILNEIATNSYKGNSENLELISTYKDNIKTYKTFLLSIKTVKLIEQASLPQKYAFLKEERDELFKLYNDLLDKYVLTE